VEMIPECALIMIMMMMMMMATMKMTMMMMMIKKTKRANELTGKSSISYLGERNIILVGRTSK